MSNDAWDRYTDRGSWAYQVLAAGYNYTMSDFQAALGHAQFSRLDEFQRRRREIALALNAAARRAAGDSCCPSSAKARRTPGTFMSCGCGRRCLQFLATSS